MLLAVDIGNTNIVFGVYADGQWLQQWRLQTVRDRMADEYAIALTFLLQEQNLTFKSFSKVVLSSVVPTLTHKIVSMIAHRSGIAPMLVTSTTPTGITLRTSPPEKTGTDLIVNAVAAYARFQDNCIIVDFGTATTIMAVAHPGELLGGAIAAGLNPIAEAIVQHTSQLQRVELISPPNVIGNNTIHAMQSGLVLGHLAMVEGLITRMRHELGHAKVIATGGLAAIMGPMTQHFDEIDQLLTLKGLQIIAARNCTR